MGPLTHTAAGNVNWYIHFGEQFGNSLLSRRRAHPITHQIPSCVHVFWRNSCSDAQDTHRRPPFQLLLLSNIRSELSGINHNHFVMLMDLERAPWRQLLWTFAVETWRLRMTWQLGSLLGPLTRAPGLPHSMVANDQSTSQKLHYFRTCAVSFPLLFIDCKWFAIPPRSKGRGIKESSRRAWSWEILLRPTWGKILPQVFIAVNYCRQHLYSIPYPNPLRPDVFCNLENLSILKVILYTHGIFKKHSLRRMEHSVSKKSEYFLQLMYIHNKCGKDYR